ncbi:dihydroorotate dehydrogenase electron transfer subunit [Oscillibacter hominis]|uniref:Dihydroorotate dehydrogenase electron transfer subunit n=1 Tax=Oscillibacter hominis TaxID=2763056 RepID=A0A7G9B5W9_9FIRM|nr:dihydroorotate dehydrogenase electron transfer subunit [Oscillibacter hominis]QNL44950.1 dihydroorotate dehydrogenase electron transfer subunit [Oscillibacter hominis]
MIQTPLTLIHKKQLNRDVWELALAGDTSAITAPGQFVNLLLEGRFLRRPISVCDWDKDILLLLVRVAGKGTQQLCRSEVGTSFDTLMGLGNGFDISRSAGKSVLVGGGIGSAPLYGLAKRMAKAGNAPAVALGFNSGDDTFYLKEFAELGCQISLATVDGSLGRKGLVTDLLPQTGCDYGFVCGPEPMLKAVWGCEQLTGGQFSFEERMGCGFGACMGCTCKTRYGSKRICKDGPVLSKEEIVW